MNKKERDAKIADLCPNLSPESKKKMDADYRKVQQRLSGKYVGKPAVDVKQRIKDLTSALKNPEQTFQHENFKAALKLYKAGKFPTDSGWCFIQGELRPGVPKERDIPAGAALHIERPYRQLRNNATTPRHQLIRSSMYLIEGAMHEIPFQVRGAIPYGSSSSTIYGLMCNDTGSNVLTLYPSEIQRMGLPANYTGWGQRVEILTANGTMLRQQITVAMRVLSGMDVCTPISEWFLEEAIVALSDEDRRFNRLSGGLMRKNLYFATAPGNSLLHISQNKTGILKQLPAIPPRLDLEI